MPKRETIEFIERNRELLETLAEHGSHSVKMIALAFLLSVSKEGRS